VVGELMTRGITAIGPHTSPIAALATLLRNRGMLPVVDRLTGS
jgi:hypothetical protein